MDQNPKRMRLTADGYGYGDGYGERMRGTDAGNGCGERMRGTDAGNGCGERMRGTDAGNGSGATLLTDWSVTFAGDRGGGCG